MGNQIRTTILLAVLTAFILFVGQMLGGRQGMVIALILAAGMNFFSYWFSHKVVLAMYRAKPLSQDQAPELYQMVETLARRANLPMPQIFVIPNQAPNAFATGRNPEHAVVAVTQGLLNLMDRREVMGVLAHEMAHVKNRDILIGSIAATLAGARDAPGLHGQVEHDLRGERRRRGRGRGFRHGGAFAHVHSGPHRGHGDPDGHFPVQGISGPTRPGPPFPATRRVWRRRWKSWGAIPNSCP